MSLPARTRLALVVLVLLAPTAAAQLPLSPTVPTVGSPTPPSPGAPDVPDSVDIDEHGLVIQGTATRPSLVRLSGPDGQTAFEYAVDGTGRARLDVAGENVISDLTLLTLSGSPLGDAFVLYLRDAEGNVHRVDVDRAGLASNVELPIDQQVPVIDVLRPPAWPGAPSADFLVYVEDAHGTHLGAKKLDGTPWLAASGAHTVGLQIPLAEADFDRVYVTATRSGQETSLDAEFREVEVTGDAAAFEASFTPALLGAQDGHEVLLQVFYERRATPLVVERFPESVVYAYTLDGEAPTLELDVPAQADDFSFAVSWDGDDDGSGLGGVDIDHRKIGESAWTSWLRKSAPKSATFSGDWGTTYEFRATALDKVGNPSAPIVKTVVIAPQPGTSLDINDAPSADITSPRAGAVMAGVATVAWTATDADGTPLTSKLELSRDSGRTWRVLYSGAGTSAAWDTTGDSDGAGYKLRLTVSDGTKSATDDVGALSVRNVVAAASPSAPAAPSAPASPGAPDVPSEGVQPAQAVSPGTGAEPMAEGGKGVPAPFVGAALLVAALLARRRRA